MKKLGLSIPIAASAVVLFVFLVTLGAVYGDWMEVLRVNGIVTTGSVDARWIPLYDCTEYHYDADNHKVSGELYLGDVAQTSLVPVYNGSLGNSDPSLLQFTIYNGYPGYGVECPANFENSGTLPWQVRGYIIRSIANLTHCSYQTTAQAKTLDCDQVKIKFADGIMALPSQPGDTMSSHFDVEVKPGSDMNQNYQFQIRLCISNAYDANSPQCDALLQP